MQPTGEQKAYLAGLIDGEGCIGIYKGKSGSGHRMHSIRVIVSMTDEAPVGFLHSLYGGRMREQPRPNGRSHWKDRYEVIFADGKARQLLLDILPHLLVKRRQAEIALEFLEGRDEYHLKKGGVKRGDPVLAAEEWERRERLRQEIRELNRRGKAVVG